MENQLFIINDIIQIPLDEIEFTYVRSSGPGGQNVNKVASKAVLRWTPDAGNHLPPDVLERFLARYASQMTKNGEIVLTSQKTRDAPKNHDDCLEKLRQMILDVFEAPKKRIPTKPTRGSIRRRLKNKSLLSEKKQQRRRPSGDDS